jgi:phosphoglycolate phosphatase
MSLSKPKAIIFDWDNTLVDTWPIIHSALEETFKALGEPFWSFDQTKRRVRKSMRDSFPEIFGPNWQKAAELYQANYRKHHLDRLTPLPGALDVIKLVKDMGIYSAVVSNKKGGNLRIEVEYLGWNKYFDKVVGSDDAKRDKPFTDPVDLAFKDSDIPLGSEVWFVGDSDIDLDCAQNTCTVPILYGPTAKEHEGYTKTHYLGFPYHAHLLTHDDTLKLLKQFA